MSYERELEVATEAAREAGEVMQAYRENGFDVARKESYTDLVTEADTEAQEVVVNTITEAFPDDGFMGEENGLRPEGEDRVWVIDPIDGTKNFAHGFPYYCTSIALQDAGETQVGVVYWPAMDEMFTAVKGDGAAVNGDTISVSDADDMRDAIVIARISSWDAADGRMKDIEADLLKDIVMTPTAFRRPGAAALDLCNLAAGRLDGHAVVSLSLWDIAAGQLIVEEAGGKTRVQETQISGMDGETGSWELVASNGHIQNELEEVLDRHVRD